MRGMYSLRVPSFHSSWNVIIEELAGKDFKLQTNWFLILPQVNLLTFRGRYFVLEGLFSIILKKNHDHRSFSCTDPRGFFRRYSSGAIIDEIQRIPDLLSFIQGIIDDHQIPGEFIITSGAQFELLENATQSLAGLSTQRGVCQKVYSKMVS